MTHHILAAANVAALPCVAYLLYRAARRSLRL